MNKYLFNSKLNPDIYNSNKSKISQFDDEIFAIIRTPFFSDRHVAQIRQHGFNPSCLFKQQHI